MPKPRGDQKPIAPRPSKPLHDSTKTTGYTPPTKTTPLELDAELDSSAPEKKYTLPELNAEIEKNPTDAVLYFKRGLLHVESGDAAAAIADFTKSIELKPDFADAYNARGLELFYQKRHEESLSDFLRIHNALIASNGRDTATLFNLGLVYSEMTGKHKESIHYFEKAFKSSRNLLKIFYESGDAVSVARLRSRLSEILAQLKTESDAQPSNFYLKKLYTLLTDAVTTSEKK
jgi:tetratricopeptide (TPR) repeat protein